MKKIKVLSVKRTQKKKVYDIQVKDARHYILDGGIIAHNSTGMFPTINVSGGGGVIYAPSMILLFGKKKIKDENKIQSGLIVPVKLHKSRFSKPIPIEFHIMFDSPFNPYVGLHKYLGWETSGIAKGNIVSQKDYEKMTEKEQSKCHPFKGKDGEDLWFLPKETARNFVVRHLADTVSPKEIFTAKIWTPELIKELDDEFITPEFSFSGEDEIEEFLISHNDLDEEAESDE